MIKRIGVTTGQAENVLVVPFDAVETDSNGKHFVEVQRGNEWVKSPVETGLTDGVVIEIKSGLKEGETVRVTP